MKLICDGHPTGGLLKTQYLHFLGLIQQIYTKDMQDKLFSHEVKNILNGVSSYKVLQTFQ